MRFLTILSFELKCRLKKATTYVYFGLFLLIGFFAIYRGSYGSGPSRLFLAAGIGNINANAPYALFYLITMMSHFGLLITAAYFGNAAHRDFKESTYDLYFSYPIKKIDYIAGRFSGAFMSTLFVFFGVGIGAFLATFAPFTDQDKIGSINPWAYLQPYLTGVVPNLLFAGAIFFSLALITRKFFPVYVGFIALLISNRVGMSFAQSHNNFIASLVDPFGYIAARGFSDYWTVAQKNSLLLPFEGNILLNRTLWLALGIALLIFAYAKFHFSHVIESRKHKRAHSRKTPKRTHEMMSSDTFKIEAGQVFYFKNHIKQMLYTSFLEFKGLVKNVYFLVILLLGMVSIFVFGFRNVGLIRGTQTYPVTYQVLDATKVALYLFGCVLILFCAGELVWRERNKKVQEIYDALPMPKWVAVLGKLGALVYIQVLMMMIIMSSGIIIQAMRGFYHFELGLYIKELFGIRLAYYIVISVFAFFVQVVVNKRFLGYIIAFLLIDEIMYVFGFKHHLFRIGETPPYVYSDMNGYGPFVKPLIFYNLFWCCFAFLLIVISFLLWIRGYDTRLKDRIRTFLARMRGPKLIAGGAGLFSCLIASGFIYYNTNILNTFETTKQTEKMSVDYEKRFKKYESTPQPRITDIKLNVDIYPSERKASSRGKLILQNKTQSEIIDVFIQMPKEAKINEVGLDVPSSLKETAKEYGVYIYSLHNPLKSGEKMGLDFDMEVSEKGFKDNRINTRLIQNGTFLSNLHLVPAISYDPNFSSELSNNDKRKKIRIRAERKDTFNK